MGDGIARETEDERERRDPFQGEARAWAAGQAVRWRRHAWCQVV